jgi:hypothetical protein
VDIAIAADPDAAILAVRGIRGITVIAPVAEAAILARLWRKQEDQLPFTTPRQAPLHNRF